MVERLIKRAKIVSEALPYIMKFHNKVIVIKYGGSAMIDPELKKALLKDVVLLKYIGMHPIIVHGGGPFISKRLKREKIESKFIHGQRVTTKPVLRVVESVLGRKVNQDIVTWLKKNGGKSKGFYGKKGRVIKAHKMWVKNSNGNYHDLGYTGHVAGIRSLEHLRHAHLGVVYGGVVQSGVVQSRGRHAVQDAVTRRAADRGGSIGVGEYHALPGHTFEVWRAVEIAL